MENFVTLRKIHLIMPQQQRPVIYQLLPRLFTNRNDHCVPGGTIAENGSGKLADINGYILNSLRDLGVTHLWLTGVIRHAQCTDYSAYGIPAANPHVVKGQAGSPYAIIDYYDIDPDIARSVPKRMAEFEDTVKRIHAAGMKVILDFVPNHVARQYRSIALPADAPADLGDTDDNAMFFDRQNNFYYLPGEPFAPHGVDLGTGDDAYREYPAKATGNDCFTASPGPCDWYETIKLNYGIDYSNGSRHFDPIPPTWHKMLHILLYWAAKGVDGFRCDMAHMVPLEFWNWVIAKVKAQYPDIIFIAEIYDVNLYRPYIEQGGFDYLYDKVNLYDTLRDIQTNGRPSSDLTACWQKLGDMGGHMLNFLENHDEQRFASPQYAGRADLVIPSLVVAATIGTGATMIYAGQELGEKGADAEGFSGPDGRTTIFDYWSIPALRQWLGNGRPSMKNLDEEQRQLRGFYGRLLKLCNSSSAIVRGAFFDLMYVNYQSPGLDPTKVYAYLRHSADETLLIAVNFGDVQAEPLINIPQHAFDFLGMTPGRRTATDLLTSRTTTIDFSPSTPAAVTIPAHGAIILRLDPATDSPKQ